VCCAHRHALHALLAPPAATRVTELLVAWVLLLPLLVSGTFGPHLGACFRFV